MNEDSLDALAEFYRFDDQSLGAFQTRETEAAHQSTSNEESSGKAEPTVTSGILRESIRDARARDRSGHSAVPIPSGPEDARQHGDERRRDRGRSRDTRARSTSDPQITRNEGERRNDSGRRDDSARRDDDRRRDDNRPRDDNVRRNEGGRRDDNGWRDSNRPRDDISRRNEGGKRDGSGWRDDIGRRDDGGRRDDSGRRHEGGRRDDRERRDDHGRRTEQKDDIGRRDEGVPRRVDSRQRDDDRRRTGQSSREEVHKGKGNQWTPEEGGSTGGQWDDRRRDLHREAHGVRSGVSAETRPITALREGNDRHTTVSHKSNDIARRPDQQQAASVSTDSSLSQPGVVQTLPERGSETASSEYLQPDPTLDFTHERFDALKALRTKNLPVPCPKVAPKDNLQKVGLALFGPTNPNAKPAPSPKPLPAPAKQSQSLAKIPSPLSIETPVEALQPPAAHEPTTSQSHPSAPNQSVSLPTHPTLPQGASGLAIAPGANMIASPLTKVSLPVVSTATPALAELRQKRAKTRNVIERMEAIAEAGGPLSILHKCLRTQCRAKVYLRRAAGVRGTCTGYIRAFDKHYNLLLVDCEEEYIMASKRVAAGEKRGDKRIDGADPLIGHGHEGPYKLRDGEEWRVRRVNQLLVRGEHVVMVAALQ